MNLKDEMQKNWRPFLNEEESKRILENIQKHFLKLQKEDNCRKKFVQRLSLTTNGIRLNSVGRSDFICILEKTNITIDNEKDCIDEIIKILDGQFTDIKVFEEPNYLELIIQLS